MREHTIFHDKVWHLLQFAGKVSGRALDDRHHNRHKDEQRLEESHDLDEKNEGRVSVGNKVEIKTAARVDVPAVK